MMIFWIAAAGLLCLALGLVLPPLLRAPARPSRTDSGNLAALQDQRRQLDQDLAAGQLTAEQHQEAVTELARRVLDEVPATTAASTPAVGRRTPVAALLMGVMVPALALGLYARLGAPQALDPALTQAQAPSAVSDAQLAELNAMVDKLAQRMAQEPQNVEGWTQLGRAYALMQRFEEASKANQHALSISPPNAQLLADQADVLAMLQGQNTQGEPDRLIAQALKVDPRNVKALALAGSSAFERQDFALAMQHWSAALALAPAGSELAQSLEGSLAEARSQAAGVVASAGGQGQGQAQPPAPATNKAASTPAVQLTGTVRLAPALAARVAPGDTLFIFARAADGPRMPLAIVRASAQQLPLSFSLDDSSAMSPQTRLSQFKSVIVGARISKSGQAMPQTGDLVGQSMVLSHDSRDVQITIDTVQP